MKPAPRKAPKTQKALRSRATSDDLRLRSRRLLGRDYTLEIAAAIHRIRGSGSVTIGAIAEHTGIKINRISDELTKLQRSGLLERDTTDAGLEISPRETCFWEMCDRLLDERG